MRHIRQLLVTFFALCYAFVIQAQIEDSLFLSKQYEPIEVRGAEFSAKYPDKHYGGGWYLDKIELPNQPTQYDTIFICDSTKLRFPAIIHNEWDILRWEVMRIDPITKKRTEYKDDEDARRAVGLSSANPFLEAQFFVLPMKNMSPQRRPLYEDFEVRAIMYRKPVLCEDESIDNWQKDTLSTIVRTYRSYNDTTWLIRCTNDPDIVKEYGQYYIKYFVDPDTKEHQLTPLQVGENGPFTHKYTTAYGCDSIVTLCVLLCESEIFEVDLGYLCEDELKDLHNDPQIREFFSNFDFYGTFNACKKQNKDANGWTSQMAIQQTWHFEEEAVIRTTDCYDMMQQWHEKYGATYPRSTIGCDRKMTLKFKVLPVKEYEYEVTTCANHYLWSFDYQWIESRQEFNKHQEILCRFSDPNMHEGNNDTIFEYSKYNPYVGGNCVAERHILHLTFMRNDNPHIKTISLCQDADPVVMNKESEPYIVDENFSWVFNPREYEPGVYTSPTIECTNVDGCPYQLQYKITVNPVDVHRDTLVYCYDDGSQVEHKWEGHNSFWANIKGQPNTIRRYHNATNPLRINRNWATPVVYELADTIPGSPCHTLYYQTVILQPQYTNATLETHMPISTDQWFEWYNVIWAGREVNPDTVPSGGKTIVVLNDNPSAPAGWAVVAGNNMYTLTTTLKTRPYRRDDGSLTDVCDSTTVTLQVLIASITYTNLGDNGEVLDDGATEPWHFGGDTTIARADGTRWHTHPYITGDYFRFYYDEGGNVIGEVDYTDGYDRAIMNGDYHANEDGTRTFMLIDTVLNADGTFSVYVQNVVVYPTFLINASAKEGLGTVEVCSTDVFTWVGHFLVDVSTLDIRNHHAVVRDTLCAQRYADRGICVDSLIVLDLTIFGNGLVREVRNRCFNDPKWSPNRRPDLELCYRAGTVGPDIISDTIRPADPNISCLDIYETVVYYNPAYGVLPCEGDAADLRRHRIVYVEPYIYDTVACRFDDDFHWLLSNGEEHFPSNLYLYEYSSGNPINRYTDAFGNLTNKIPDNNIPTDLDLGFYTVCDSLRTVGCYCDSVLTLNYEILENQCECITAFGTCGDNLTWKLSCEGVLTIKGTGAMADFTEGGAPWSTYSTAIISLSISESITKIGNWAFQNCFNLTSVTCYATTPPELGIGVFYNVYCPSIPLYVPAESVELYKAADQWKDFYPILPISGIEGIEDLHVDSDKPVKLFMDGHIYILRGDHIFDTQGKMVR